MSRLLQTVGVVLVLGGLAHSISVIHFYVVTGVLFSRAPITFRVPPVIYLLVSVLILTRAVKFE